MVFMNLGDDLPFDAQEMASRLAALGVKAGVVGPRRFRLVTHCWIDDQGVEIAVSAFEQVLRVA
jgi:threonine aldolase